MAEYKAMAASWARSFAAACLAQFLALGGSAFDLDGDALKSILAAGLAAVLPVLVRWLNPNDSAFGVNRV
jgi:hypothetical protein